MSETTTELEALASAMRKVLPAGLLRQVLDHLDPLSAFVRDMWANMPEGDPRLHTQLDRLTDVIVGLQELVERDGEDGQPNTHEQFVAEVRDLLVELQQFDALFARVLKRAGRCLINSAEDEPVFVLTGRDIFAAARVREWADAVEAYYARTGGTTDAVTGKVKDARRIALAMDAWRAEHGAKVPD